MTIKVSDTLRRQSENVEEQRQLMHLHSKCRLMAQYALCRFHIHCNPCVMKKVPIGVTVELNVKKRQFLFFFDGVVSSTHASLVLLIPHSSSTFAAEMSPVSLGRGTPSNWTMERVHEGTDPRFLLVVTSHFLSLRMHDMLALVVVRSLKNGECKSSERFVLRGRRDS
ncbi:hypothetical protein KIN20_011012 [Parelaphostrongylus tenuis]|uniref:Uncharacterized protein n=1 Tax=Parelaphostrongylus tenuis TaxID=148309 RepID=A0AAD5MAF0_PARTN|nr:hypothetical protein KIN20_011012 [Parelaphostrongylus tenuis]